MNLNYVCVCVTAACVRVSAARFKKVNQLFPMVCVCYGNRCLLEYALYFNVSYTAILFGATDGESTVRNVFK